MVFTAAIGLLLITGLLLLAGRRHRYSPVVLPWFAFARGDDTLSRIHRLALDSRGARSRASLLRFALTWPVLSLARSTHLVIRYGAWVRRSAGVGLWSQWWHMVRLANTRNIMAETYYVYRLWEAPRRERTPLLIQGYEHVALLKLLNARFARDEIHNKLDFYEASQRLGLPTAPIIAAVECDGSVRWFIERRSLPQVDLFLKPVNGGMGKGAERWLWREDSNRWCRGDRSLTEEGLLRYVGDLAKQDAMLIQPRLRNHSSLEGFGKETLCTLRVVTHKCPGTATAELGAVWRMSVGGSEVDNFAAGGIVAELAPDGTLGFAVRKGINTAVAYEHPDTGRRIAGSPLPFAKEMRALALDAHQRFGDPPTVGWDVAATEDGVLLVEGNQVWDGEILQKAMDVALLDTPYRDTVSALLDAAADVEA